MSSTTIHALALALAALLGSCASSASSPAPPEAPPFAPSSKAPAGSRPNVVLIFTDDQGYGDLSCMGSPTLRTPRIDALATEGTKLTQFYVASPVCSPSRAALLTGCYPKRVGIHQHVVFPEYDYGLHPDEVTIADLLSENGYATGCFGKWHLGHRRGMLPTDQGFDTWFGTPYSNDMAQCFRKPDNNYAYRLPLMRDEQVVEWEPDQRFLTRRCTEAAIEFIDAHQDEPFFVYVPHAMPHIPLYASPEFEGTSARGLYGDVIEEIDWSVGQLVDALEARELLDNTLILFMSDNGPWAVMKSRGGSAGPLRGAKGTNWEGGQRVPFVAHWPGRVPAGVVSSEVVTTMDMLPTIARLAGAEPAPDRALDGHDVGPLLFGEDGARSPTDAFVYYTSRGELAGVRRGPWKLLLESGELYQLEHDISELWDQAAKQPELVLELRALAEARDAEISAGARPVYRTEELVFDPRKPE